MISNIPVSFIHCFNECLITKWLIELKYGILNDKGNSVVLSNNNLKIHIAQTMDTYTEYENITLRNNLINFTIDYPQLIGVFNGQSVDFTKSSCFNSLETGRQYYINDKGSITIQSH